MYKEFEKWEDCFCKELCEEVEKFKKCPNMEHLKKAKDLVEVINGLNEMEMDEAIRQIAEDYGYDSHTGRFHDTCRGDDMMEFMEMFNAGRRGGTRRRRDSRGRFMAMAPRPTTYYPYDPDMYPLGDPHMMNDGRDVMRDGDGRMGDRERDSRMDRRSTRNDGRSYPNGTNMDENGAYMLRQHNGMPIMTPYNMGDVPKKLTDRDCEEWIDMLIGPNGEEGPHWTKPQIEAEAKRSGIDISKYGLPLITALSNAMWADYSSVAKVYNCDKPSFYIRMAEAFLNDEDFPGSGVEKASLYFHKIVEHE